jgi:class 3 adenylate cyclase
MRHVAMLFSDIEGSTELVSRLGAEWLSVLATQRRLCRAAWEAWRGDEMGTEGDSFFVVFADEADAVHAAIAAQEALNAESWPNGEHVRVRMGVHAGPAVRHEEGYVGVDVHRAARVGAAAHGGQVLVSGPVYDAVRERLDPRLAVLDLGAHDLKGLDRPERLVQVTAPGLPTVFPPPRSGPQLAGVADYRFIRSLGESAHGVLYLAVPPPRVRTDAPFVTVKVVEGGDDEATVRRVTRELQAFARVSSPYLVRLLDAGRHHDRFFYATEYCELGSLADPQRPLVRDEVLRALAQVALAAQALHDAGLVHRGIKPSNVLLKEDGARLSDLGLIRALEATQSMTSLGAMSAVEFTEPVLVSGGTPSPASDVWSLAATLHWGLTGHGLFGALPEDDPLFCVRKVLTSRPRLDEGLTGPERELVARVLEAAPESRPTARELADRLSALVGES